MKRMKGILEKVYDNTELRQTIVPLFRSNPGLGKSQIIKEFAKERNANVVEIITSQILPYEVSGMSIPVKETGKMTYYDFDRIDDLKDGDILFFDELLNGNPVVINACLTLLESRVTVSGKALPNIMIVAAANPQGQVPLTPAIKERFVWYDVVFDPTMWKRYVKEKYNMPATISSALCTLISAEKFNDINFMTPRSVIKALKCLIKECPTPYSNSLEPLLMKLVTNTLPEPVDLGDGRELKPGDQIGWLSLIKLLNGIMHECVIIEDNPLDDDDATDVTFRLSHSRGNKLATIKLVREFTEQSLKSCKDLVELTSFSISKKLTNRGVKAWTSKFNDASCTIHEVIVSEEDVPF